MNPAQQTIAAAYAHVFAPCRELQVVMDDWLAWCNTIPDPQVRAGAILSWGHAVNKSRILAREKVRNGK